MNKKRSSHSHTRKKKGKGSSYPRWAWWLGGVGIIGLYIWVFYHFFVSPFGFRWRALYGDAKNPKGYEIRGIDISHYQGKINWEKLSNAQIEHSPIRFVVIKATEGSTQIDDCFLDNFKNARDYGFIRGAYHFWSNKSSGTVLPEEGASQGW